MPKISSCVALVSGGASGLGEAVARRLVGGGARVVIADLNKEAAATLAASLGPNATSAVAVSAAGSFNPRPLLRPVFCSR